MKKKDFILIGIILLIIIASFILVGALSKDGAYVVVRVDGEQVAKYSLQEDGEYQLNGGSNLLRIEQGKAYLIYADCKDKLCVKHGKIDKSGQTITCLPNRLTITVYESDVKVDLVS